MTHSNRIINLCLLIVFLTSLTACRTTRTSEKAVSESATASGTVSRRTFYRSLDSLSRQVCLSADSIIFIFATSPESPREFPSGMEGPLATPSSSQFLSQQSQARQPYSNASRSSSASRPSQVPSSLQPQSLKIYGLHLAASSEEKSTSNADLKDSVNTFTQSQKLKSAKKLRSKPSTAPYFILILFIITLVLYAVYRLRRII